MSKVISAFLVMFSLQAGAMSLHPCTPTQEMQATRISCKEGSTYYTIIVRTLASRNLEICQGENRIEYKTAYVEKSTYNGNILGRKTISNGEFSYKSTGIGEVNFKSRSAGLNLKCVVPMHGAFSIGN